MEIDQCSSYSFRKKLNAFQLTYGNICDKLGKALSEGGTWFLWCKEKTETEFPISALTFCSGAMMR